MVVYLDLMLIFNFLVDFFLLLGTNRLAGFSPGARRAALAAALGAIYSGACFLPTLGFLRLFFWRIICLMAMSGIAFGWSKVGLRRGVLFVFLSMALGGIAIGLGEGGFWSIVLGAIGVCLLCVTGFAGRPGAQRFVPLSITHGGKECNLQALVDTGNCLRDPISGATVVVADETCAMKLLGLTKENLLHPLETMVERKELHLRLIPYSAVGQSGSMLLAIKVDRLEIEGKPDSRLVAFAPQKIGLSYQALLGGVI